MNPGTIFGTIRAMSFGGLVTAGIGTLVYYRFPHVFGSINAQWFIGGCAAFGAALQRGIEAVISYVFNPIFNFLSFHEKLFELTSASCGKNQSENLSEARR